MYLYPAYYRHRWNPFIGSELGFTIFRLVNDSVRLAELHWYQANNIGKREFKIKLPFLARFD